MHVNKFMSGELAAFRLNDRLTVCVSGPRRSVVKVCRQKLCFRSTSMQTLR